MCVAVLFSNSKWEDNKLVSPQEMKLRCRICDVNSLWGPESKSYKLFDINYLSGCIQAYGWWIPVPGYDKWFTLGVSNFYVKRKQNKNHLYPHTATLDFCIGATTKV